MASNAMKILKRKLATLHEHNEFLFVFYCNDGRILYRF